MSTRILYCHCAYAKVLAPEVKQAVLEGLTNSGLELEAVPDLCEMSARRDEPLQQLASNGPVKIAACFPRAVKWLFHSAGSPLPTDGVEVLNMREQPADVVLHAIMGAQA